MDIELVNNDGVWTVKEIDNLILRFIDYHWWVNIVYIARLSPTLPRVIDGLLDSYTLYIMAQCSV